ncbi:MAG: DUF559 domain-containing protein [Hyphomicrobiales bacterium]
MYMRTSAQTARARRLRREDNPAEAALWVVLRSRQLAGHKFVRQLPLGPYYADFACRAAKLVIEVDGGQHAGSQRDARRDYFMAEQGYAVLRIPSTTVLHQRAAVCDTILAAVEGGLGPVRAIDLVFVPAKAKEPSSGGCAATFSRKREK